MDRRSDRYWETIDPDRNCADTSPPVGTAQEDWIPLRPSDYYRDRRIDLLLHSQVSSLDTKRRQIVLENVIQPGLDGDGLPTCSAAESVARENMVSGGAVLQ